MKIFALLIVTIAAALNASGQNDVIEVGPRRSPSDLPEWTGIFPEIQYCTKMVATSRDNRRGKIYRRLEYQDTNIDFSELRDDFCATAELEIDYPFTPPPPPKLTNEESQEQERLEKRTRKGSNKLQKMRHFADFFPKPRAPRLFIYKGYHAREHFRSSCDTECPSVVTVEVQFGSGRILRFSAERSLDQVISMLDQTDFEKLNSAVTQWLAVSTTSVK